MNINWFDLSISFAVILLIIILAWNVEKITIFYGMIFSKLKESKKLGTTVFYVILLVFLGLIVFCIGMLMPKGKE